MISWQSCWLVAMFVGLVSMLIGYSVGKKKGKIYLKMAVDLVDRMEEQARELLGALEVYEQQGEGREG